MTTIVGATQRIVVNKPSNRVVVQGYAPSPDPGVLNDLSDVSVPSPTDGYALTFNSGQGLWVPKKLVDAAGDTMSGKLTLDTPAGVANETLAFPEGYSVYADNAGAGSDNTRLWFQSPDGGEIVFGPRSGAELLDNMRLRSDAISMEGAGGLVGWNGPYAQMKDHNNRQFIRGATETSGATLVPVFISGKASGTTDALGYLTVSFGETFSSAPNVVVTSTENDFKQGYISTTTTTSFTFRCYTHTGAVVANVGVSFNWMAFGRRAA